MKLFGKRKPSASMVSSLIGSKTTVTGDITFEGGLRVEGTILGSVVGSDDSMLVLTKNARITGSIRVSHAIIDAPVEGPMIICETLELKGNARINGSITYKDIVIQTGAIVNGQLIHTGGVNVICLADMVEGTPND